jgi:hypothetical protein
MKKVFLISVLLIFWERNIFPQTVYFHLLKDLVNMPSPKEVGEKLKSYGYQVISSSGSGENVVTTYSVNREETIMVSNTFKAPNGKNIHSIIYQTTINANLFPFFQQIRDEGIPTENAKIEKKEVSIDYIIRTPDYYINISIQKDYGQYSSLAITKNPEIPSNNEVSAKQDIEEYTTFFRIVENLPRINKEVMQGETKATNEKILFNTKNYQISIDNEDKEVYTLINKVEEVSKKTEIPAYRIEKCQMRDKRGSECTCFIRYLVGKKEIITGFEFIYENIRIAYMVFKDQKP